MELEHSFFSFIIWFCLGKAPGATDLQSKPLIPDMQHRHRHGAFQLRVQTQETSRHEINIRTKITPEPGNTKCDRCISITSHGRGFDGNLLDWNE